VDRSRWDFFEQLAEFGPEGRRRTSPISQAQAEAYCRRVARDHYENFQVASWFLPRHLRQDFVNIYAYSRWADDCADEVGSRDEALRLLDWWQGELERLFAGQPAQHPVMRALATTIQRHGLSKTPFLDLISAFAQDQVKRRYESAAELDDYCRRSANPVGRLLLGLGGCDADAENVRLSDSICTGLQLANFCQDMARDAGLDRIYAPRQLWTAHGVDEAMILAARPTPPLKAMLRTWVSRARADLDAGGALPERLPKWLALDVRLFRGGGLAILDEIARAGYDVWTRRPVVSKLRKLRLLAAALVGRLH
jgi:squalene synthase HpnC